VPADAVATASAFVGLVDQLTEDAVGYCVELQPLSTMDDRRRRDGRPVSEHVVDRRLTTAPVLRQERRLLDWAAATVERARAEEPRWPDPDLVGAQQRAAAAVAGSARTVLVVGPAGAGKTTMLRSAVTELRQQGRPVIGLAPSGKAADVLACEA